MDDSINEDLRNLAFLKLPNIRDSFAISRAPSNHESTNIETKINKPNQNISSIRSKNPLPKVKKVKQIDPSLYKVDLNELKKQFSKIKRSPSAFKETKRKSPDINPDLFTEKERKSAVQRVRERKPTLERVKKKAGGLLSYDKVSSEVKRRTNLEFSTLGGRKKKQNITNRNNLSFGPNFKFRNNLKRIAEEVLTENGITPLEHVENRLLEEDNNFYFDSSKCVYCLNFVTQPITLKCYHEMCLDCADEKLIIKNFLRDTATKHIKCTLCSEKTPFETTPLELIRKDWKRNKIKSIKDALNSKQVCEICPDSREVREVAEYECLNCDTICCYECKGRHLGNPRHINHKIIRIAQQSQEKTELTLCERHREPNKLYCLTDNKPCCLVCSSYEDDHIDHTVKSIRALLEQKSRELAELLREKEKPLETIFEFHLKALKIYDALVIEKQEVLVELERKSDALVAVIRKRQAELENDIKNVFGARLEEVKRKLDFAGSVSNRMKYYRRMICLVDIDVMDRINLVKALNKKIGKFEAKYLIDEATTAAFDVKSLGKSVFVGDPELNVETVLRDYVFKPIEEYQLIKLNEFFANSTVMEGLTVTPDIFVCLPEIENLKLLYKLSKDGCSPEIFHEKCDNQGKTLLLVKVDTGHVFGGFCPVDFISEYMYCDTTEAFLFSLTDGKFRKPFRCKVRNGASAKAIKQNEVTHSPSFGETDYADLMIAFKNLKSSYSKLGNTYECPRGYDGLEFLAGRPTDWNIIDIEIFAVEMKSC